MVVVNSSDAARPVVSICIPSYNGEPFIGACIESALAQTVAAIEVLVVDDVSTDATVEIATAFSRRDDRVRIVRNNRNLGLVGNWNHAISVARGEWIKLLFQDDLLAPTCTERLLAAARGAGVPFAACARGFAFEEGTTSTSREWYLAHQHLVASIASTEYLSPEEVARFAIEHVGINFVGEPTVTLIHRDLFDEVGLFDAALTQRIDTEFWVRAGVQHGIVRLSDELATFRVHSSSASFANYSNRRILDEVLDPLVILHHYLYDPSYATLRLVANSSQSIDQLHRQFWDGCQHAAPLVLRSAARDRDQVLREWARVTSAYPRIVHVPIGSRLGFLARRVKRRGQALRRRWSA